MAKLQGKQVLSQALRKLPHLSISVTLDCTRKWSSGLTEVCNYISTYSKRRHEEFSVTAQVHFLNRLLQKTFGDRVACQVHQIIESATSADNIMLRKHNLLLNDPVKVSEQLLTLCQHGQILYFQNVQDITQGWVILKKELLLSEVNGYIFAPKELKPDYQNFDSTGVVALSEIARSFPKHDSYMLMNFMTHLDFCHQLQEADISIMGVNCKDLKHESYYFFPGLVNTEYPTKKFETILKKSYKCGWCLHCKAMFFTSRFLHVLLLRLAFTFALPAAYPTKEDNSLTTENRQCNIWKNGIHWLNMDGVETIVQVVQQNTQVVVLMGCLKGSEVKCIQLRSAVIEIILSTKKKYSPAVDAEESFIKKPEEIITDPLVDVRSLYTFPLGNLKLAIKERKENITNKIGSDPDMVNIDLLLYFEPYTCLSNEMIAKLINESNKDVEIPDDFLYECAKVAHPKTDLLKSILLLLEQDSEYHTSIKGCTDQYSDDRTHKCFTVFKTWKKFTPNPTYGGLREALDRYSIFRGRYPLPLW